MAVMLDQLLDQYDKGHLNRRQLLKGLALATGGAFAGNAPTAQAADSPLAPATTLNHVHLEVTDVNRSVEFYSFLVGAKQNARPGMVHLPGATPERGLWMSIQKVKDGKAPGINHVAYGTAIPQSDYPKVAAELKKRYPMLPEARVFTTEAAGQEIYITDPDGIQVQLMQLKHNG